MMEQIVVKDQKVDALMNRMVILADENQKLVDLIEKKGFSLKEHLEYQRNDKF